VYVLGDLGVGFDEQLLEEGDATDGFESLVLLGALVDDHHERGHLGVVDRVDEIRPGGRCSVLAVVYVSSSRRTGGVLREVDGEVDEYVDVYSLEELV
jgi:hypothetical protein